MIDNFAGTQQTFQPYRIFKLLEKHEAKIRQPSNDHAT